MNFDSILKISNKTYYITKYQNYKDRYEIDRKKFNFKLIILYIDDWV